MNADPLIGDVNNPRAQYVDMAGMPAQQKRYAYFHEVVDEDRAATMREGRPMARTRVFICIPTPGDPTLTIDRPMKEKDKLEYPQSWAAFQAKKAPAVEGTPIESWPLMSRETVFEMKALHIHTVEQFISIPESLTHKIMGYQTLKQKALAFLAVAKDSKAIETRDAEIAALRAQVEQLTALVKAQPEKRGPGRPKKANAVRRAENGTDSITSSTGS